MKKRSKITAVVREEKENEKRYHKKHKLIIKRKESVIKFEQDKTSLNKIWPPQFFFVACLYAITVKVRKQYAKQDLNTR